MVSEHGGAFFKGGVGCLAGAAVAAVLAALAGRLHDLSLGEAILLFVVGGLIGLAASAMAGGG